MLLPVEVTSEGGVADGEAVAVSKGGIVDCIVGVGCVVGATVGCGPVHPENRAARRMITNIVDFDFITDTYPTFNSVVLFHVSSNSSISMP